MEKGDPSSAPSNEGLHVDLLSADELWNWLVEEDTSSTGELSPTSGESTGSSRKIKVLKNDIRRFLPKMFLHTVNAGHFRYAQSFCDSFIAQDCKLSASFDLPSQFLIPGHIDAEGPLQFSHFVLGYLLMFPDIVMTIVDSNIMAAPEGSTGSSILMGVEFSLTKTAHIPFELWVPPVDLMDSLYRASTGWQLTHVLNNQHRYRGFRGDSLTLPTSSSDDLNNLMGPSISLSREASMNIPPPLPPDPLPKRVPERYSRALHQVAVPVNPPRPLQLRGELTFQLDEQNHIVHMEMVVTAV